MEQNESKSPSADGIDRRGFLRCMQWAGTGVVWSLAAGAPVSELLGADKQKKAKATDFTFVQISDTHMGFNRPANTDVVGTLRATVRKINELPHQPDMILHTGDLTHLAKASEFDLLEQNMLELKQKQAFYVPGEHDVTADDAKLYLERFGKGAAGTGWRSFDHKGVHFVGLNNAVQLEGLGAIGAEQMDWLRKDLADVAASSPVVVFAHIPLWAVYPKWGWATKDSEEAMGMLKRFGSVTVLNGHIHQVLQKVEGKVTFHTAMSTAFPQPAPGSAPSAGPMVTPAERLRKTLGLSEVSFVARRQTLATVDSTLES